MSDQAPDRPQRPQFSSGLPQRQEVPRPRTTSIVRGATWLALLSYLVPTVLAVLDQVAIRAELRSELVERAPDYDPSDIGRAVLVTLIALVVIGAVLSLLEVSAASALHRHSAAGRTTLLVLITLHVPVLVITQAFRDVPFGTVATTLQAVLLLVAVAATVAPATRRWLRSKGPIEVTTLLKQQDRRPG